MSNGIRDAIALVAVIKACARQKDLQRGQRAHVRIIKEAWIERNVIIGSSLISLYAKCGVIDKAQETFDGIPAQNTISWNALISGYVHNGYCEKALACFAKMQAGAFSPDTITLTSILKACSSLKDLEKGHRIHNQFIADDMLHTDVVLGSALISMYAKCGAFEKAEELLHQLPNQDVVSWTALIAGYTQNGYDEDAMVCFKKMQSKGFFPDAFTYSCIFKACGNMLASDMGEKVHSQVRNNFLIEKNLVVANGLIDMYAKCGNLDKAKDVFDGVAKKDIGSWNALIAGYTRSGQQEMVLELFTQMQVEGFPHDAFTLMCILKACTSIGSTDLAFMLHDDILKYGWDRDVEAGTALAMMYANCYMVQEARGMFNGLPMVDMISWSALMEGYGKLGSDELLLELLSKVIETNVEPDLIMSTIVLNLCNHRGLLEVAQRYFKSMWPVYGMHPNIQHYTCLIDLLCRVGDVDRAILILLNMPFLPTLTELNILMGACTTHGNTKLGKWAFEHAVELDENSVPAYVFMGNIHVSTIEV